MQTLQKGPWPQTEMRGWSGASMQNAALARVRRQQAFQQVCLLSRRQAYAWTLVKLSPSGRCTTQNEILKCCNM